jgi:hypothetical protein
MNVGVFGNGAPYPVSGSAYFNDKEDPQGLEVGLLDIGGGSASVRHTTLTSPFESVRDYVEAYGGRVQALMDNSMIAQGTFRSIYPVPDVCLLFLKAWASEGYDRENIDLAWNATAAVDAIASLCPKTVVVLSRCLGPITRMCRPSCRLTIPEKKSGTRSLMSYGASKNLLVDYRTRFLRLRLITVLQSSI